MKNMGFAALALVLLAAPVLAQTQDDAKVASFETGGYNSRDRESISFWTGNGRRTVIEYRYGSDDKAVKLAYLGPADCGGRRCFKVGFPNKLVLYVTPGVDTIGLSDTADTVRDAKPGSYQRTLAWQYEGPIDGRGTFCNVCAKDGKDATALLRQFYLKK